VKEVETASDSRHEYDITKPSRADRQDHKDSRGLEDIDFKFSGSEHRRETYEFQMRFYLFLAREIFSPFLCAKLFHLKDGLSVNV